jgi:long-chain acyl-CoA synthetase
MANDDSKTIIDYFLANVKAMPDQVFMTQPIKGDEDVRNWTFAETLSQAKKMANHIKSMNFPPNSKIAIMSKNCSYWIIADLAIWMSGHVSVPVYPTLTAETTKFILEHSESKLCFVGKLDEKPWLEMKNGIPSDMPTISFPLCPEPSAVTWDDLLSKMTEIESPVQRKLDEMATIIYTSGSTGKPKGVMTSFKAMTLTTKGICKKLNVTSKDRYLSYLPVAHGMERWVGECVPLMSGEHIFFAESLTTFVADLNRCKPTLFLSVPRLWTKFQAGVFSKTSESKLKFLLSIPLLNILVRRKILKALGLDQVRFAGSGSAPLPQDLLQWYRGLGLELLEGYGMTENFNYSHMSLPGKTRVGYVGNTWEGVDCRIADDGEIQIKGPGNMMGYYKNEEATKETLTEDGYVRTGDKGAVDAQGRLKITGRTKEIFKTSKGKYVAPAPIENLLIGSSLIELACVGGKSEPQPHAIIQLSEAPKARAAKESEREIMGEELAKHMAAVNATLDGHEKLDYLVVVKDDWLPENGFLTPTQKIKRAVIEDTYSSNVSAWAKEKKKVIWYGF